MAPISWRAAPTPKTATRRLVTPHPGKKKFWGHPKPRAWGSAPYEPPLEAWGCAPYEPPPPLSGEVGGDVVEGVDLEGRLLPDEVRAGFAGLVLQLADERHVLGVIGALASLQAIGADARVAAGAVVDPLARQV